MGCKQHVNLPIIFGLTESSGTFLLQTRMGKIRTLQFMKTRSGVIHFWANSFVSTRKTIVFINSLGTDFRIWDGVVAALGENFNIILHDKSGHGLSSCDTYPTAIADYADDVCALLQHLKIPKVLICGISVGGLIAQCLYLRYPALIEGLILSNTALKIDALEMWGRRISNIKAEGIPSIANTILERWFAPQFKDQQHSEMALYRNMLIRMPQNGYIACCQAICDADFTDSAADIKVPVFCIAGEYDSLTPPALLQNMALRIPNATYNLISGAAHLPCIEYPELYANLIFNFIESI